MYIVPSYVVICMVEKDGDPFQVGLGRKAVVGRKVQKRVRTHPRSLHRVAVAAAKTRANAYCSAEMHLQAVVQIWAESGWAKFAKTGLDGFVAFSQLFLSFLSLTRH